MFYYYYKYYCFITLKIILLTQKLMIDNFNFPNLPNSFDLCECFSGIFKFI